jgi:hypothetical protein
MSQNITKTLGKYVVLFFKDYKKIHHHGLTLILKLLDKLKNMSRLSPV